ncbi:MAG: ABC transporter ATP-binding protein [Actinomycetaceae bacterium]|nr:ABC transporter ATP-binding protein [Actinomycetaceae bacterium]
MPDRRRGSVPAERRRDEVTVEWRDSGGDVQAERRVAPPSPARLLEVEDLTVTYPDGHVAVRGASLTLGEGRIVALLGASGSGKSSLLRGIAGLESATGTVRIRGVDVSRLPAHRRDCGMVFQDGLLFPHRNVARNIAYGIEGWRRQTGPRVAELLALVGLEGFEERDVATLSGGQAQRVALARSLARRPALMLLDEPLSALDRQLREDLAGELRRILTGTGTGAVYVTHDHQEAATVADDVVRMTDGVLDSADPR